MLSLLYKSVLNSARSIMHFQVETKTGPPVEIRKLLRETTKPVLPNARYESMKWKDLL